MSATLCRICNNFPWDSLDRARIFRFAWWKTDNLQVPEDESIDCRIRISLGPSQPGGEGSGHEDQDKQMEPFRYHADIGSMRSASANGCHICSLVLKGFNDYSMDAVGPARQEDAVAWYQQQNCRIHIVHEPSSGLLKFDFETESASRNTALRYYFVSRRHHTNLPTSEPLTDHLRLANVKDTAEAFRPKLSRSASSDHTFSVINYWINKCQRLHSGCARDEAPQLPTRVIDVSTSTPFLHISTAPETGRQRARYTALSHRWGVGRICMTKKGNLDTHCAALPLDQLSNVFLDVLTVTRRLGISYIWIDSLCIIQDSPQDWEVESGRMADIYSNAFLTISAALSGDEDLGLFAPRDDLLRRPCRVELAGPSQTNEGHPSGIDWETVRIWNQTDLAPLNLAYLYPLYTRAWVFQEQTLSPRILHFTSAGVHWECLFSNYAEPEPLRHRDWNDAPVKFSHRQQTANDPASHIESPVEIDPAHGKWLELIETYSGRDITFDSDRLPAMSGIAKAYKSWMGGLTSYEDYVSGMWSHNFFPSLTWYPNRSRLRWKLKRHERTSAYVAPSWSWASVNGPVSFLVRHRGSAWRYTDSLTSESSWQGDTQPLCTLLEARSVSRNSELDPTGRIRSGRIVVLGPVCESPFIFMASHHADKSGGVVFALVRRDDPTATPITERKNTPCELDVLPVDGKETPATHLTLLRIYPEFALILERIRDLSEGVFSTYRRVGWCLIKGYDSEAPLVRPDLFQREEMLSII